MLTVASNCGLELPAKLAGEDSHVHVAEPAAEPGERGAAGGVHHLQLLQPAVQVRPRDLRHLVQHPAPRAQQVRAPLLLIMEHLTICVITSVYVCIGVCMSFTGRCCVCASARLQACCRVPTDALVKEAPSSVPWPLADQLCPPCSILWLLRFPPYGEPHVKAEAAARGVDPARIIFTDVAAKPIHIARSGVSRAYLS